MSECPGQPLKPTATEGGGHSAGRSRQVNPCIPAALSNSNSQIPIPWGRDETQRRGPSDPRRQPDRPGTDPGQKPDEAQPKKDGSTDGRRRQDARPLHAPASATQLTTRRAHTLPSIHPSPICRLPSAVCRLPLSAIKVVVSCERASDRIGNASASAQDSAVRPPNSSHLTDRHRHAPGLTHPPSRHTTHPQDCPPEIGPLRL